MIYMLKALDKAQEVENIYNGQVFMSKAYYLGK